MALRKSHGYKQCLEVEARDMLGRTDFEVMNPCNSRSSPNVSSYELFLKCKHRSFRVETSVVIFPE